MTTSRAPIVVIGAGLGGLSAALHLAAAGRPVIVIERADAPGGKMRQVMVGGLPVDAGPTVFTMRWVFEELFAAAGTTLESQLTLRPLGVLARHEWQDGARLDLFADTARSADAIGCLAGAAEARGYRDFIAHARRTYATLEGPFLRGTRPSLLGLVGRTGPAGPAKLLAMAPFSTLWQAIGRTLRDPRLRQLFGRYATYVGSSPFQAPATLMLIAHVEQSGVWSVDGGMHRLAQAMEAVFVARGGVLRLGTGVAAILTERGRVSGVRLDDGELIPAAAVVANADVAALAAGLLGAAAARAVPPQSALRRSLSAITWAMLTRAGGFPLVRHNVFFARDSEAEFAELFARRRVPRDATVYVCAQDRGDDAVAPADGERLLCLVNAPACGDTAPQDAAALAETEARMRERLGRAGLTLAPLGNATHATTPEQFERLFPATGGALYGQAVHGWQAAFNRPSARTRLPGLYLAGGGTHPGAGTPMATLSGRLAAAAVLRDMP